MAIGRRYPGREVAAEFGGRFQADLSFFVLYLKLLNEEDDSHGILLRRVLFLSVPFACCPSCCPRLCEVNPGFPDAMQLIVGARLGFERLGVDQEIHPAIGYAL